MATDLPQAAYKQQVHSGRNPDGTRHDGAGDPLMGLDRITTEDWEIGRTAGHMSVPYDGAVTAFFPVRFYRTPAQATAGVDRLIVFGEITAVGGGSSYQLHYRLGDGGAWTAFALAGAALTQWYAGSDFGTYSLDISSVVSDWITIRIIVIGEVLVYDLGGWFESSTLPVL